MKTHGWSENKSKKLSALDRAHRKQNTNLLLSSIQGDIAGRGVNGEHDSSTPAKHYADLSPHDWRGGALLKHPAIINPEILWSQTSRWHL